MKKRFIASLLAVFIVSVSVVSCKKYDPQCNGDSPTYQSNIKRIIDANCTKSGCHPSFATYNGIKPYLLNNQFKSRVLDEQSMPQGGKLSHDELDLIQCWHDQGYPEK